MRHAAWCLPLLSTWALDCKRSLHVSTHFQHYIDQISITTYHLTHSSVLERTRLHISGLVTKCVVYAPLAATSTCLHYLGGGAEVFVRWSTGCPPQTKCSSCSWKQNFSLKIVDSPIFSIQLCSMFLLWMNICREVCGHSETTDASVARYRKIFSLVCN